MNHLAELRLQVAAYALGRRIGVCHLRMAGLQILQFVHQLVEIVVADLGLVQHIILIVMLMQLASQLLNTLFLVHVLSDNHFLAVQDIKSPARVLYTASLEVVIGIIGCRWH